MLGFDTDPRKKIPTKHRIAENMERFKWLLYPSIVSEIGATNIEKIILGKYSPSVALGSARRLWTLITYNCQTLQVLFPTFDTSGELIRGRIVKGKRTEASINAEQFMSLPRP